MSHLFIFGDKNMCMFWDCDDHKSFNMGCGMDFELENFNSFLPIVSAFGYVLLAKEVILGVVYKISYNKSF
jgi:hypothetical protein